MAEEKILTASELSEQERIRREKLQGLIDELSALDYTTQMGYVTEAAKKEIENYIAACKKNAETVKPSVL